MTKAKPTKTRGGRGGKKTTGRKRGRIRIQRNHAAKSDGVGGALDALHSLWARNIQRRFSLLFEELRRFSMTAPADAALVYEDIGKSLILCVEEPGLVPHAAEEAIWDFFEKCHLLHRKRTATPNRAEVRERAAFRQTAWAAVWEVAILHDAGWKRHWSVNLPFPAVPFGSKAPEHVRQWKAWAAVFFKAQVGSRGIVGRKGTQAGSGSDRGRNEVLKKVFDEIYELSEEKEVIHAVRFSYDKLCEDAGMMDGANFLECMANRYPECVNIS